MDEKYIATLLEKYSLNNNFALFRFVNTIFGTIDPDTNILVDDYGNEYFLYHDKSLLFSEISYAYGNPVKVSELFDYLDCVVEDEDGVELEEEIEDIASIDELTLGDLSKIYNEDNNGKFYLVNVAATTQTISTIIFDTNSAIKYEEKSTDMATGSKNAFEYDGLVDKNVTYLSEVDEDNKDFFVSTDNIISMIVSKKLGANQLKELRNKLVFDSDNIDDVIDAIDLEIETQEGNKNNFIDENVSESIKKEPKEEYKSKQYEVIPFNTRELFKNVTKTVIAQDEPAKRLITEIFRLYMSKDRKDGILLTGSTGVGKTELISNIAKYLNRDIYIADSTRTSAAGYVGTDIEEILWQVYVACDKNIKRAENAILFFDEIDKKGSSKKDDVSGQAVLNGLLKLLDGSTYKACESMKSAIPGKTVDIKTNNMLVIAGGAFSDVYGDMKETQIGFNSTETINRNEPTLEDFVNKAMMPREFMGRFPVVIHLNDLNVNDLRRILVESEKSPIKKQEEIFRGLGVELKVTPDCLTTIAQKAYDKKAGARSLNGIINAATWKSLSEVSEKPFEYESLEIDERTIEDPKIYKLTKKQA